MANDKAIITEAANRYGVRPDVLWGLYGTETSFGKNLSISSAGAVGPFQFLPSTARGMGVDPNNFKSAAFGAARYLAQYKGRGIGGMLSAYNAGPAGGYQSGYVEKTLQNAKSYGQAPRRGASGTITAVPQPVTLPSTPARQVTEADAQGLQKARGLQMLAKLISSEKGSGSNPLLTSGLLSTKEPLASEYIKQRTIPGREVASATIPQSPPEHEPKLAAIVTEANHISEAHVPYLWGGGHQGRVLPGGRVTPLDCSGAVSAALGINPKVSGEFESWGQAGKGAHLTIYANSKHVLMEVDGRFWGTSGTNPGGGAGWIKSGVISPDYLKGFTARHPSGEQVVAMHGSNPILKAGNHSLYIPREP